MKPTLQKVLLIEDNADIRTIVKLALEKVGGLTVCVCGSGAQGLQSYAEFEPQLILLDVMMPNMDGPAVLRELQARPEAASVPVVFLTAKTTAQEVQSLRALGAAEVIAKPFDPLTLHKTVKNIWDSLV